MHTDQFGRHWTGPFPFDLPSIKAQAPKCFGVYEVLYTPSEGDKMQVAYIGIATGSTIYERLRKHRSGLGNWALGRLGNPASFRFVFYECDKESAKQIESHTIVHAKPPFNVKHEYKHYIPSISVH